MTETRDTEGVIRDHYQSCGECDGHGYVTDDPMSGETYECYACDGEGHARLGSWYAADTCECAECGEEKRCGCMAENNGLGWYVCFDCYIAHHKKFCGCNLWKKWEAK